MVAKFDMSGAVRLLEEVLEVGDVILRKVMVEQVEVATSVDERDVKEGSSLEADLDLGSA